MSQFIEMFGSVDDNPKSYDIKKVGDFAECFAGATPSTKISSYWDNGNIPWMSSGEVHKARVQDTDAKITQQGYDGCSTKMVPIHSIVIALAGQGKTRGTVAINDIELCTNQSLCAIVPNEEVNYEYLFHNLRGRYKELRSMSGDVDGRGGLNLKHIQSIKVIVPPMSEQMKFVSIARQADKSGFDGRKSQFIEMFGDPVSWQTDTSLPTLNDTVNVISGFPFDSEKFDTEGVGTPLIRIRDIQRGYSETFTTEVFDEQYRIKKYELLVGMDGMFDIARWQSDEAALNQRVCCLRMKGSENDTFIQYLVQPILRHIENGTNATTVKHISTKQINGIRVPIASHEQKNKFAMIANQADKSGFRTQQIH